MRGPPGGLIGIDQGVVTLRGPFGSSGSLRLLARRSDRYLNKNDSDQACITGSRAMDVVPPTRQLHAHWEPDKEQPP